MKIGIAGACGRGGRLFETVAVLFPDVTVEAICDVKEDELPAAKERLKAGSVYTNFEEMLDKSEIDAVIIGSPMQFHASQAMAALEREIHTLSEVTAGVSIDECKCLVETCKKTGALYVMGENYIYTKPNMIVEELVKQNKLGTVFYAEGEYIHELKNLFYLTPWRRKWQKGVNGITYGTHSLGPILQWFQGQRVVSVCCVGSGHHYVDPEGKEYENEDTCVMFCRMSEGGLAKIRVDMITDRPHNTRSYQLQGTDGSYESARSEGETDHIWLREMAPEDEEYPEWQALSDLEDRFLPDVLRNISDVAARSGHGGGDYFVLSDFFTCIKENRKPRIGIHEAMDMTLPGLVSQASIQQESCWLPVPDSREW